MILRWSKRIGEEKGKIEAPTELTMKVMFWNVTLCILLEFHRYFGGTYSLHL
jgi:hypothetical protein